MGGESSEKNRCPGVSARCVTFKRIPQLQQALYCYLQQDYTGPKELLIFNDDPDVEFIFEHPEIRIINYPHRFGSVYDKVNEAVKQCKYNYVMPWPDDDIFAPWAIRTAIKYKLQSNKPYLEITPFYKGTEKAETISRFHICHLPGLHIVEKQTWIDSGGHPKEATENQKTSHLGKRSDGFATRNFKAKQQYDAVRMKSADEIYYLWRCSRGQPWGRNNWKPSPKDKYKPDLNRIKKKIFLEPKKVICPWMGYEDNACCSI